MSLLAKFLYKLTPSCFLCSAKPAINDPYTIQYSRTIIEWHLQPKERQIYIRTIGLGNKEKLCDGCFKKVKAESSVMETLRVERVKLKRKLNEANRFAALGEQQKLPLFNYSFHPVAKELLQACATPKKSDIFMDLEIQLLSLLIAFIEHQTMNSKETLTGSLHSKLNDLLTNLYSIEDVEALMTQLYPSPFEFGGFEKCWASDSFFQKIEGLEESYHLTRNGILVSVKKKIQQLYLENEKAMIDRQFMYR